MNVISTIPDGRIGADNVLLEASIGEYLGIAKNILANNEYQRRRVKFSPTIYSLLKVDLVSGCVMPPIVLASVEKSNIEIEAGAEAQYMQEHSNELLILDGLQRTYSMLELEEELVRDKNNEDLERFHNHTIRLEIYLNISRLNILYRMLTLNTGQTPMSLRQQVEILYSDYTRIKPEGGIQLIREVDNEKVNELGKYSFKAIIDGFNSYLDRNELPIDRYNILDNVKSLEKLSTEQEPELFQAFIETYHQFVMKTDELSEQNTYSAEELGLKGQPFGLDARRIFTKEQAIAGFGAAVGKLNDYELVKSFAEVRESVANLVAEPPAESSLSSLLQILETIRLNSKKIGNSQRLFFQFYFRELFNPEGDAFRNLSQVNEAAYKKYLSQTQ